MPNKHGEFLWSQFVLIAEDLQNITLSVEFLINQRLGLYGGVTIVMHLLLATLEPKPPWVLWPLLI